MRLISGDELILKHPGDASRPAWQGAGMVVRLSASEEVGIELKNGSDGVWPTIELVCFSWC